MISYLNLKYPCNLETLKLLLILQKMIENENHVAKQAQFDDME